MTSARAARKPCTEATRALTPISEHIHSLYAIVQEDEVLNTIPWHVGDWLLLAAGLRGVSIVTNGLAADDDLCPNIYEEVRGPAFAEVATELTRLLFLWGALQGLMRTKWGSRQEQGQPRLMAKLTDSSGHRLLHQECAARNLLAGLDRHANQAEYRKVLDRARRLSAGQIGQATFAAYQLRNSLAHGAVPWPDNDSEPAGPAVLLASTACRVLSFAIQVMILDLVPPGCEVNQVTRDGGWTQATITEVLPTVHLREV